MDDHDQIYLWIAGATFIALTLGIIVAFIGQGELASTVVQKLAF